MMFTLADGPTALRADLIRGLSLAVGETEIETADGVRPATCGVAGVWNDSKGAVVVVVRHSSPAKVMRYAYADPIATEEELDDAVDEALGFAEALGFLMDAPDFQGLRPEERESRLGVWDAIRKVRKRRKTSRKRGRSRAKPAAPQASPAEHTATVMIPAPDPLAPQEGTETAVSPAVEEADDDSERAVLARISLVTRGRPDPVARLRSFF